MFRPPVPGLSRNRRPVLKTLVVLAVLALPALSMAQTASMGYTSGNSVLENKLIKPLQSSGSARPATPFEMNAGLNDGWYNPVSDGQGFFVKVLPGADLVSLSWFTYASKLGTQGTDFDPGDTGHRWITAIGSIDGNRAELDIDVVTGGLVDRAAIGQISNATASAGKIILTFDDCVTGLIEYDIVATDQRGSFQIQRIANDNIALCETLSAK